MSKGSYTVVRSRKGRDRRFHAMMLNCPTSECMCGARISAMVVATTADAVDCDDCQAMIIDLIRESRRRRGQG